uniref:Lymphotoxin-alpha n=1 Tax=Seriola dumerili TaxID=41447 RepID=A0A3B4UAL9_SERDU
MEDECKVQLDATVSTEARKHTTQGVRPSSKLTTALLAFTLCLAFAAAATYSAVPAWSCCAPSHFMNLCLLFSADLHHTLRQISNGRPAIHLEGKHNESLSTSVEWKNNVDQSHATGGLKLENNEIVIPRTGLYFVYSQASFRVSCTSSDADDATSKPMVHLSHTVKRWSSSYGGDNTENSYQTILHSVRTACQKTASSAGDEEGNWYTAVYMGAVFNLRKGDRLKTVMEERMLLKLEDEPGKTFFGVFAL